MEPWFSRRQTSTSTPFADDFDLTDDGLRVEELDAAERLQFVIIDHELDALDLLELTDRSQNPLDEGLLIFRAVGRFELRREGQHRESLFHAAVLEFRSGWRDFRFIEETVDGEDDFVLLGWAVGFTLIEDEIVALVAW